MTTFLVILHIVAMVCAYKIGKHTTLLRINKECIFPALDEIGAKVKKLPPDENWENLWFGYEAVVNRIYKLK